MNKNEGKLLKNDRRALLKIYQLTYLINYQGNSFKIY